MREQFLSLRARLLAQFQIRFLARLQARPMPTLLALLVATVMAISGLVVVSQQAWAAIELAYDRASVTSHSVLLEWATVQEFNVAGYEIQCKLADKPDIAYEPLGSVIASGGPDRGETYSFQVTSGLVYGAQYCFRLREITTDGVPGEQFDLCGYGPGVTPAPTAVITTTNVLTLTPIVVQEVPGVAPAPTLQDPFAFTPTPTATLFPGQTSPLAQPGVDLSGATATATPTFDPLATPTLTLTPTLDPLLQGQQSPLEPPTLTPTPTLTPSPTVTNAAQSSLGSDPNAAVAGVNPQEGVPESPTATPTVTALISPITVDPTSAPLPTVAGIPDLGQAAGVDVAPSPTPLYVVVTATPTPAALAMAAPTFTPWPTATTTPPPMSLTSLLAPNTQNLMVMLLCLIFLSASGLGVLGLVTSVLYMRSQARRDRYLAPPPPSPYARRRY